MWKVLNQSFPSALQSFRPVPCPLNADVCGRPGLWVCSKHVCVGISGIQTNFLSGKGRGGQGYGLVSSAQWLTHPVERRECFKCSQHRVALSAPAMELSHLFSRLLLLFYPQTDRWFFEGVWIFFILKFISIFLSKRATEVAQLNWAGYAESKLCLAGAVNTVNWRWAVYEMLGCLRQTGR